MVHFEGQPTAVKYDFSLFLRRTQHALNFHALCNYLLRCLSVSINYGHFGLHNSRVGLKVYLSQHDELLCADLRVDVIFNQHISILMNYFSYVQVRVRWQVGNLSSVRTIAWTDIHNFWRHLVFDLIQWLVFMSSAQNYNDQSCKPSLLPDFDLCIVSLNPHFAFHPKRHYETAHSF